MNDDSYNISEIIFKEISGTIEKEEKIILENWLESDVSNKELFENIRNSKTINSKLDFYNAVKPERGWEKYKQMQKKRSGIRKLRIWYAAASVIVTGIIISSLILFYRDANITSNLDNINPGIARATLILEDGEQVELGKDRKNLTTSNGIELETEENTVRYIRSTLSKDDNYHKILIPKGGEYSLELADRTRIWANSETTLSYPTSFSGKQRIVYLEGEAYFEVAKNKDKPFIVITPTETIRVLGTKFNISTYKDDIYSHTTLLEGSVSIENKDNSEVKVLVPGQQAMINYKSKKLSIREVNAKKYTDWIDGRFVFEDESLESIMKRLSRWYNINVEFKDPQAANLNFTGNFIRYDKISTILNMFEMTNKVKFSLRDNVIIVEIPVV